MVLEERVTTALKVSGFSRPYVCPYVWPSRSWIWGLHPLWPWGGRIWEPISARMWRCPLGAFTGDWQSPGSRKDFPHTIVWLTPVRRLQQPDLNINEQTKWKENSVTWSWQLEGERSQNPVHMTRWSVTSDCLKANKDIERDSSDLQTWSQTTWFPSSESQQIDWKTGWSLEASGGCISKRRAKIQRRMLCGERSLGRGTPKTWHVKNSSSKKNWENN